MNSTTDFVKLRRKAGRVIAQMCKRVKIFWLNQQQNGLLPPPLLPGNQGLNGILPPPLPLGQLPGQSLLPPPPQLIPGTGSNKQNAGLIPPPALPKDNVIPAAQNQNRAPPVISSKYSVQAPPLLVSGDSGNMPPVSNQNAASNIETPPPLALWLQMQRYRCNVKIRSHRCYVDKGKWLSHLNYPTELRSLQNFRLVIVVWQMGSQEHTEILMWMIYMLHQPSHRQIC